MADASIGELTSDAGSPNNKAGISPEPQCRGAGSDRSESASERAGALLATSFASSNDPAPKGVIGVRVRGFHRVFLCVTDTDPIEIDDWVAVATSRGEEAGRVVIAQHQVHQSDSHHSRFPSCRLLTSSEVEDFDRSNRDMAAVGNTDVGVDEEEDQRLVGGLGRSCLRASDVVDGHCSSTGSEDQPRAEISPLNPGDRKAQFSTHCRRSREDEIYRQAKSRLPQLGQSVETADGHGAVIAVNVTEELVTVRFVGSERAQSIAAAILNQQPPVGSQEQSKDPQRQPT